MSRYTGAVTRLSRRLGTMLFTNTGSKLKAFQKKGYKPGQHGQKRFSQISEYNKHLQEKQKARFMYGVGEKQFSNYFKVAVKSDEATGVKFMKLLEQRLDNVVFRAGIGSTRPQARQLVAHGLITLNGKKASVPSIQVKVGDKFEISDKKKSSKLFENIEKRAFKPAKWIKANIKTLSGEIIALPDKDDIEQAIDNQLITEFYSK
ncbi:MAG: 30S ribosomal protein S4 [Candidatus Peregrinibacteria bacterium]|nr:30S ribosomal protein S4 [Candidatus Peregrinibacteria bacterium]